MHLVGTLASGVRGAENGSALIYRRGTSLPATLYPDFEASSSNSSGAPVVLDSYGGAEVYVGEVVDVVVFSSAGVRIREFTDGVSAANVELISPSFTGTDYETAAVAVSKPVTLTTALARLVASFGAPDFQVELRGSEYDLDSALAEIDLGHFNAKGPSYGAVGDGVANDRSAIQAAITAAGVAGGTVILPPGTYRIGGRLTLPQNVNLIGAGPAATTIMLDHATEDAIDFSVAARRGCTIEGISFDIAQGAAGAFINVDEAATRLTVRNCRFAPSGAVHTGISITSALVANLQVTITDCYFLPNNVNANAITLQRGSPVITGCQFVAPAGAANNQMVRADGEGCFVAFCQFDFSDVTSGTCVGILATNNLSSGRPCIVLGNSFGATSGGTVSAWQLNCTSGNGVFETANIVATGLLATILGLWDNSANEVTGADSWEKRIINHSMGATTSVTLSAAHGQQTVTSTGAGMQFTMPTIRVGQRLRVIWHNNNAGAQSLSAPAGAAVRNSPPGGYPYSVAGNSFVTFDFHGIAVNGTNYWLLDPIAGVLAE